MGNAFFRTPLDFHDQTGQDVIENGRRSSGGSGVGGGKSFSDILQAQLWDYGARVDVIGSNPKDGDVKASATIKGAYPDVLLAKKFLKERGFKVSVV